MEAARAWGVPHSVFKGRVVQPGAPLWTGKDRALAVALHRIEAVRCSGCGQDRRESLHPDNEFSYVATAQRCHACAARDRAAAAHAKQDGSAAGMLWAITNKNDREGGGVSG